MKYVLEVEMENDKPPTMEDGRKAANAAVKHLPGVRTFWMIRQENTSSERR